MYKFKIFIRKKELSGRQFHCLYIYRDMETTNLLHFGTRPELRQWLNGNHSKEKYCNAAIQNNSGWRFVISEIIE